MSTASQRNSLAACIEACRDCHDTCLSMATGHCLFMGGHHSEPEHIRTMLLCAQTCELAISAMVMESTLHKEICELCADICDACAASCSGLEGMEDCYERCRTCKDLCESMSEA